MVDQMTTGPTLDPFAPGFFEDPYAQYAAIRESGAVHRTLFGPWMLTHWEHVHQLLRDPTTSVEDRNAPDSQFSDTFKAPDLGRSPEELERGDKAILNIDPPDHTRLRKLVSKAFTPRTIEQLRPRVDALVADLLDRAVADAAADPDGRWDVISGLAFPLPFAVISELLGMPESTDIAQLRNCSHTLVQVLDPILAVTKAVEINEAGDHMIEVITDAIAWKRGRLDTDDDLLAALIRAEDDGDMLNEIELRDNVMLLFMAGHETTVNLIGNGTNALLRNRTELDRLVADPDLDAGAVEELLRYDSPVQISRRIMLQPVTIAEHTFERGDFVMTGLGAANRDPAKFGDDADRLRLDRESAREHVSFGSGVHHCLGAALARLEGRIAIGSLVRRFPRMELVDEPPAWNGRIILRGLDRLHVTLY
jgi:cytochrome P450